MTLKLSDEVALLALEIERAGEDPESIVLARLEFEALWLKFKRDTQALYDAFTLEAREEHDAAVSADLERYETERRKIGVVK